MDEANGEGKINAVPSVAHPTRLRIAWTGVDDIRRLETKPSCSATTSTSSTAANGEDIVLYGHSSGTSTGLPKPIPIRSCDEIGALPRFHESNSQSNAPSTFTTTPIYTGGLADLWRSWSAAVTLWTFPEDQIPVTEQNVLRFLGAAHAWQQDEANQDRTAPIGYFSCVPFVVQMMVGNKALMQWLRDLEMVGVGGAAMPGELGDKLVKDGVNLVSRFGSRECGFLLSSHRDFEKDKEWQFLRKHELVDSFNFQKWNDTDYELVVSEAWPSLSPAIHDNLPFNSHDVFQPHPTIPSAWRYCGRSDVQITLVTGKKFDPAGIESALCTSSLIQDAVVVGDNRQRPAALLFLIGPAESLGDSAKEAEIWEVVRKVNEGCPSHARIERDMVRILPSSEAPKIQKSSKGTIMRRKFAASFAQEIQDLYKEPATRSEGAAALDSKDYETRVREISSIVQSQIGRELPSLDSNFYGEGVDSMACMQIRNRIKARLSTAVAQRLALNVVYEAGNVRKLAGIVGELGVDFAATMDGSDIYFSGRMMDLVTDFVRLQPHIYDCQAMELPPRAETSPDAGGRVVLLTGSTGFLGAHILAELLQVQQVSTVILPVRLPSVKTGGKPSALARLRVQSSLESYDLPLPAEQGPTVRYLAADLDSPTLGLSPQEFRNILGSVTDVIHGAWAVNFNIPLAYFETQLRGLVNLYNIAALSQDRRGVSVSFTFISSTASATSSPQTPVPELISKDPKDASGTGYGRSKWVAEKLLDRFAVTDDPRPQPDIVRVGQLCGSTSTGIWNMREAWPMMLDAGIRCMGGKLPDLDGVGLGRLDWLPVDLAARSILDIALLQDEQARMDRSGGSAVVVYHVLNCGPDGTTWADVQRWLTQGQNSTVHSGSTPIRSRVQPIQIIPAQEWLDSLESLESDHPAKNLLGLWREGWKASATDSRSSMADRKASGKGGGLQFDTWMAERFSPTMSRAKEQMAMSEEAFWRMLEWIVRRGGEMGVGVGSG